MTCSGPEMSGFGSSKPTAGSEVGSGLARSEGLEPPTFRSVGVGKSSRTVRHRSWAAGPTFQSCPRASGAVQRLGYSLGYSSDGTALILDRLLFRPDISPSWRGSCERYRPSPVAAACRWLLLLLSPLLSAAIRKASAALGPASRSVPSRAPAVPPRHRDETRPLLWAPQISQVRVAAFLPAVPSRPRRPGRDERARRRYGRRSSRVPKMLSAKRFRKDLRVP